MPASSVGEILLRQIPAHLLHGIQRGEMKVYGSIIRSLVSGRITGHLQETSGFARLPELISGLPVDAASIGVDLIGHTASYVQGEQIKSALSVLNGLQVANLAVGTAAIGVSVAGFAVLAAKLRRLEGKIDAVAARFDHIARRMDALHRDRIAEDLTSLSTTFQLMDEAWDLPDPEPQWQEVARQAHSLANQFKRRASEALDHPELDPLTAEPFLEALALAAATRVSARLAAGDTSAAAKAAEQGASDLIDLGDRLRLAEIALGRVRTCDVEPGTVAWSHALKQIADEARPTIEVVRERESAASATILTLHELSRQQISGRAWLEAARNERDVPLFCLLPQ